MMTGPEYLLAFWMLVSPLTGSYAVYRFYRYLRSRGLRRRIGAYGIRA